MAERPISIVLFWGTFLRHRLKIARFEIFHDAMNFSFGWRQNCCTPEIELYDWNEGLQRGHVQIYKIPSQLNQKKLDMCSEFYARNENNRLQKIEKNFLQKK